MPTTASAKLSVLVTPATKRRLQAEAEARKLTVGELVRQCLSGEPDPDERQFMEALVTLGQRAAALGAKLDATNAAIDRDRADWPKREAEIRRRTLAALSAQEREALRDFLAPSRKARA